MWLHLKTVLASVNNSKSLGCGREVDIGLQ